MESLNIKDNLLPATNWELHFILLDLTFDVLNEKISDLRENSPTK